MATAKVMLNEKYKSKDGTFPIIIRLINGKQQKLHSIGEKISQQHWTGDSVKRSHPEAGRINSVIDAELSKAKLYFADCRLKGIPVDLDLAFAVHKSHSFTGYLLHRSKQHMEAEQIVMGRKVKRFANELLTCFKKEVYFSEVNHNLLRDFEAWLIQQGNGNNTRQKKYEMLKKYFGNAITEKKAFDPNPFATYVIPKVPTKKEKLSPAEIKAIEELQPENWKIALARDLFLFSYYCKGLRFENVITMPKTALVNGRLYYTINKGNRPMSTAVHPKLKAIIDRYIDNKTDTIFGRINKAKELPKAKYISKVGAENTMANQFLKSVAALAGIKIELSMHHARHSFAHGLKVVTGNVAAVQDSLGHSRSQTTENYLKSLDDERLDSEVAKLYNNQ